MLNEGTICIGFGGYGVAVCSNVPKLLTWLERSFRHMLESGSERTVARLDVSWAGGQYHVSGKGEVPVADESLLRILHHVTDRVRLHLIEARPDLLWFHAGAAAHRTGAVMIVGPWGRGKSTLVTGLCARGWSYLSDELVALDLKTDRASPFPQTPAVREDTGQEIPPEHLTKLQKRGVDLQPRSVCRGPKPVGAIILPIFSGHTPGKLAPCSPANAVLDLLQNCLNFTRHRQVAVGYLCDLLARVPSFRLSFSSGALAAEMVTQTYDQGCLVRLP